ncbi:unnamed protein product, partial [Brachionus calyciflorus]
MYHCSLQQGGVENSDKPRTNSNESKEQIRERRIFIEGVKNDDHLSRNEKEENLRLEKNYTRHKYGIRLSGSGIKDFKNINSRMAELNCCTELKNPLVIQPVYDTLRDKYFIIIAVESFESFSKLSKKWADDAFQSVVLSDRPPILPIIITNIGPSVDIKNGIVYIERIYKHDKSPSFSIKPNVLTLLNFLRLIRDGIHLDFTGMRHNVKPAINYAQKCLRCGDDKYMITACKNQARSLNCKGKHQCNNNTCPLLVKKTIQANKYVLDLMKNEEIIKSNDEIIKQSMYDHSQDLDLTGNNENIKNFINSLIQDKLNEQSPRIDELEKITKTHSSELVEIKNSISQVKVELDCLNKGLNKIEEKITNNHSTVEEAIQRLSNCFYLCIYKLLKINLNSADFNDLNNLLEKYGLFAFQHRALERMLTFSYKIINLSNSPPLLKEELVKNETRNLKYDLRNKDQIIECGSKTNSGEKTFKYIFSRLSNKFVVNKL